VAVFRDMCVCAMCCKRDVVSSFLERLMYPGNGTHVYDMQGS